MPDFSLRGKVVVVTGGLGRLGREYIQYLAGQKARVAVLDRQKPGVKLARGKGGVLFIEADVTRKSSLEAALARIRKQWKTPDGLINNAAVDHPPDSTSGRFEDVTERDWDEVMDVNLKGVFFCCQVFGGAMAQSRHGGSIINVSSVYGMVSPDQRIYEYRAKEGRPFFKPAAYSVSKGGIFILSRYLATYWASRNVRVNTLVPAGVFDGQDSRFLKAYNARIPMGRMAMKKELTGAVHFLLAEASSYMTGTDLVVDGGMTAW